MARPTKEAYDLSDAEKRDLTQLIQKGKPLPEKYRFILFEDKREVELVWNGKTRDVCTTVLPFQSLEHVDEPRKEAPEMQSDLFDTRGRQLKGWTNKLIWGDNKLILSSLKSGALRKQIEDAGGLKLIYIDPPFDVGADFSMDIEIGGETFHKEANLLEQIAYRDTWGRGADSFIAMIYERLILMRDLMAPDGCIYVHCDWHVGFALRSVLNEIFGSGNFINEIVWHYYNKMAPSSACFPRASDRILSYSKTRGQYVFHQQYEQLDTPVKRLKRQFVGGRAINVRDEDGIVQYIELDKKRLDDVWRISMLQPADKTEYLAYRTQKPEVLVERILQASSNEGDLVADFFCGSGTTAAVAEKLGRKWICTDLGKFAVHTTRKRMIQVQREAKDAGNPFRAFEVLNLGRYERQAYLNVGGRLTGKQKEQTLMQKEREFRDLILRAYRAEPLEGESFFHGKNAGRLVVIGPINLPVGRLFVEEVITECRKRGASRVDMLAFEFEMGLFPAVLEEAKQKGIDLTPKQIPPEVFDKCAVEKGQVVFFDISFIEAMPRYGKKDKFTLQIELTDFSVYYSQGAAEAAAASLKVAKSMGTETHLPGIEPVQAGLVEFEERWTGSYIFENEWQSFRTRKNRELEFISAPHTYTKAGRHTVAVKVIDIFGNDTMVLVPVSVG